VDLSAGIDEYIVTLRVTVMMQYRFMT